MNPYKIFLESMQRAGIDPATIAAVADIHNAIYDAAEDESDESNEEENDESDESNEPGGASDDEAGTPNVEPPDGGDTDVKGILYGIIALMNSKQNAYQHYHWNAESKSLHEAAMECYELYQETKDKLAETLMGMFDENIDFKVWSGKIPNLSDVGDFLASVNEDMSKITEFRSQLEQTDAFGVSGLLDGLLAELTKIKYGLVRFFENKAV